MDITKAPLELLTIPQENLCIASISFTSIFTSLPGLQK